MKEELREEQQELASQLRTSGVRKWHARVEGDGCEMSDLLRRHDPLARYPMFSMCLVAYIPTPVAFFNISILLAGSVFYGWG